MNDETTDTPTPVKRRRYQQPTAYKPEYCGEVIEYMAQGYSLAAFAGHVGVSRETTHNWQERYPEFREAVRIAKVARLQTLERGLLKEERNPTKWIFALKNAAPDEWRDVHKQEISGPDGAPMEIDDNTRKRVLEELLKTGQLNWRLPAGRG